MGKTFKFRNQVKLYIRNSYKPIWIRFLELAKKDPELIKYKKEMSEEAGGAPGIVSLAVMRLVYNYVMDQDPNFKIQNETPSQDTDQ